MSSNCPDFHTSGGNTQEYEKHTLLVVEKNEVEIHNKMKT